MLLLALLLCGWLLTQAAYRVGQTASFAVDTVPVLLPFENAHEVEQFPDGSGTYRWTRHHTTMRLPNPGGSALLTLRMAGGSGRTVAAHVQAGATSLHFVVQPDLRQYRLLVPTPASQHLPLVIASDTFEERNRSLGLVLSRLHISGGGGVPGHVLLALWAATISGYMLLRQAGGPRFGRRWWAALAIVALQSLVLLWQAAGGWRYGLFVPLLLLASGAAVGALLWEGWLRRWLPTGDTPADPPWQPVRADELRLIVPLVLLALAVRLPWLDARDPVGDLELAARRMGFLYYDGLAGAYTGGGDYMPLRLYMLAGLGQMVPWFNPIPAAFHEPLPFASKLLVKLPGLLADMTALVIIYAWGRRWLLPRKAAALAALYTLAPPVWINVAWWGQVDTLLMLPLLCTVVLLERAGGRWSWLCWTLALLLKPQAIVLAPLLYTATLRLHGSRGVLQGGLVSVGVFGLVAAPLVLAGQGPGLMQAYLGSVGRFPNLTAGAYNLWYLLTLGGGGHDTGEAIAGLSQRTIGLLLVASVGLLVGVVLLRRASAPTRVQAAAVLTLAFFALPTQIHERYLFFPLAFLALRSASNERMVLPFGILAGSCTLNIFGDLDGFIPLLTPWIAESPLPLLLAATNLLVLAGLLGHLGRMKEEGETRNDEL